MVASEATLGSRGASTPEGAVDRAGLTGVTKMESVGLHAPSRRGSAGFGRDGAGALAGDQLGCAGAGNASRGVSGVSLTFIADARARARERGRVVGTARGDVAVGQWKTRD